jgi:hypothetical protein
MKTEIGGRMQDICVELGIFRFKLIRRTVILSPDIGITCFLELQLNVLKRQVNHYTTIYLIHI